MQVTISLNSILIIAAIILSLILMIAAVKLIKTLGKLNVVLDDVASITSTVAGTTQELDVIVSDVSESLGTISTSLKSNQSSIKAAGALINSLANFKRAINRNNN